MTDTPLSRVRAFQRAANPNGDYHWPAEETANIGGVPLYFDDIESLTSTDELDAVEVAIRRLREAQAERDALAARVVELEDAIRSAEEATAAWHNAADCLQAQLDEAKGAAKPEPCDKDCDCDCQPGQPCLCPERDCYCGPCPVCDRNEDVAVGQQDNAADTAPACLLCDCTGCQQCSTAERTAAFERALGHKLDGNGAVCFCYLARQRAAQGDAADGSAR